MGNGGQIAGSMTSDPFLMRGAILLPMKKPMPNLVMNGHKSDVPDLASNDAGNRLRAELSLLPHATKDNELCLEIPVKLKVLSFLLDKGLVWTEHTVSRISQNCFINSRNEGKAYWTVVDYKLL
jgi:hypothetical protein